MSRAACDDRRRITLAELPLFKAIRDVHVEDGVIYSERLLILTSEREKVLRLLLARLDPSLIHMFPFDEMLYAMNRYRKMPEKAKAKLHIAFEHIGNDPAPRCFYDGRVESECSEYYQLDRIKPGARDGEYTHGNTVVACSKHNCSRGCKEVEAYLRQ